MDFALQKGQGLRVSHHPILRENPDGSWNASYAMYPEWMETGTTMLEARNKARDRSVAWAQANPQERGERGWKLGIRVLAGEKIDGVEAWITTDQDYYDEAFKLLIQDDH